MKATKEQVNEWYKQSVEISEQVYSILQSELDENKYAVYQVGIDRWNDRVNINAYVAMTVCGVDNDLRSLVGNESVNMTLSDYTEEGTEEKFIEEVASMVRIFARRADIAKNIIEKNKENQENN